MTDKERGELVALLRTWMDTSPGPLPDDWITRMAFQQLRSEAIQGARALLTQLKVELGESL